MMSNVIDNSKNKFRFSPLNYIGNKRKLLSQIVPLLPTNIDTFVDLFCGGCSMGLNSGAENIIFNDNMPELVELYKYFQSNSIDTILNSIDSQISKFQLSKENKEGYINFRNHYNETRDVLDFYILMAYSFNNQYNFSKRDNKFNTAPGYMKSSFNPSMRDNLIKFVDFIQNNSIIFENSHFTLFNIDRLKENDVVYVDPPYLMSDVSFYKYKWTESDEYDLLNLLDSLHKRNIKFALSNVIHHKGVDNTILKNWGNNYKVININKTYSNCNYLKNSQGDIKNATQEVLVVNY